MFLTVLVFLLFAGCGVGIYFDRKEWNNGACPCGKGFWMSRDMDSQGGVLYGCSYGCGETIWQSWGELLWTTH